MAKRLGRSVTHRCVDKFALLLHIGIWLTLGSMMALVHTAWRSVRTGLREGSLVLPIAAVFCTLFSMSFALVYPFDWAAVLNPRYLLPQAVPMAACLAFALARMEGLRKNEGLAGQLATLVVVATLAAIGSIAALLVYIRFGS